MVYVAYKEMVFGEFQVGHFSGSMLGLKGCRSHFNQNMFHVWVGSSSPKTYTVITSDIVKKG